MVSKTGAYSPCGVLFRNAGLGSVWDWGDPPDESGPTGETISLTADCRLSVNVSASVGGDTAVAVSSLRVTDYDLGVAAVRLVGILCDGELFVTELLGSERDCDQRFVVTNAAEIRSDERVIVVSMPVGLSDVATRITNGLSAGFDVSISVSVIAPELYAADMRIGVSGTVFVDGDLRFATSGVVECLADAGIVVFGMAERLVDLRSIIGGGIGLDSDISAVITNARFVEYDIRLAIAGELVFLADTVARILRRMTPDADTAQTIYVLLVRESHMIQV